MSLRNPDSHQQPGPEQEPATLDRREFIQMATATVASGLSSSLLAEAPAKDATQTGTFTFSRPSATTVPLDFNGLSYESAQLNNPDFFAPGNTALIKLFRNLSPTGGVLRIGGNLSEYTEWRDHDSGPRTPEVQAAIDHAKNYFEWILVDARAARGRDAIITPAAIENLAGFLKATGWKLIYGLNLGTGTPERAAAEAACVHHFAGSSLIAFQLGNEVDFYGGNQRPKGWNFDRYFEDYARWTSIVRATTPNAPFAGPDTAVNLDWVKSMAEKDAVLLTSHHYAMGPAGAPGIDAQRLLRPDPALPRIIEKAREATAVAGIPFRMAEGNSCFHGGQPGVSNAFASALWVADFMLLAAQGGFAGVNLHGGGEGIYSPIIGDQEIGFITQPIYFGMQFAQQFAGATFLEGTLSAGKANLTACAARRSGELLIALITKEDKAASIAVPRSAIGNTRLRELWTLSAPAIDSRSGATFKKVSLATAGLRNPKEIHFSLDPYTAILARFR